MSVRFHRRVALAATGLAVASTITAAPADAWVGTPQHSGSGRTVAGQVRITYTNPLDASIKCRVGVYPVAKLKILRQSAYFSNLAEQQLVNKKKSAAQTSLTHAAAALRSAGLPLYESRTTTSVSPGTRKIIFIRPSGKPARHYSALTDCRYANPATEGPVAFQGDTTAFHVWPVDV
ncbi:hypothetical protein GII33_18425 [Gordonia pseudamarae]|jgi:hypothetical protein|uniref:Uncharacterized protein n=1 Tax=Gordonia pseudamarae TaxID=2831662 RepID=A0ABX6IME8_9ACTN|nr:MULTISPECIES: hypothetical protein [Gordonia]MBD0020608.1 hypothetical protein [Gordonia sp. (in: high G+C Gram-positive bacteria)]QHN27657.1 hypothetical protein GII33_18425 [Gordonia pseudamarae]QHN36539.1 hypothetical protein GII31_18200 [Gordonia pseudamarae]